MAATKEETGASGGGGRRFAARLEYWGPMVLALMVIGVLVWTRATVGPRQKKMAFTGTVVELVEVTGRRSFHGYVVVRKKDGKLVRFRVPDTSLADFDYGDEVVKLDGEDDMAVFRDGRQLRGKSSYLDREVTPPDAPQAGSSSGGNASAPASPDVPGNPEAEIDGLIAEASAHWRSGNRAGSLDCANKALALCNRHLGPQHPKTASVQRMIAAASQPAR